MIKLSEIRKACEAATRPPWRAYRNYVYVGTDYWTDQGEGVGTMDASVDAEFIALSRQALPALLEAIDAWRQYRDSRHMLCTLLERAGIEVDS